MKLITTTTIIATLIGVKATPEKKYMRERNLVTKAFDPILLGPGAAVPLFKQCLEYGPVGMHPCNPTETIVAAYQDAKLKGEVIILTSNYLHSNRGNIRDTIIFEDGLYTSVYQGGSPMVQASDYPGGGEENYFLYCCSQNQALS